MQVGCTDPCAWLAVCRDEAGQMQYRVVQVEGAMQRPLPLLIKTGMIAVSRVWGACMFAFELLTAHAWFVPVPPCFASEQMSSIHKSNAA